MRRLLATARRRTGIMAGSWQELLHRARNAYLVSDEQDAAEQRFRDELGKMAGAFWSQSFSVAPDETAPEIRRALVDLVSASDPSRDLPLDSLQRLAERPRRIVGDLAELAGALAGWLPGNLGAIRRVLDAPAVEALHSIRVYVAEGETHLTRWQHELVEKLNRDADQAGTPADPHLASLLELGIPDRVRARPDTALEVLQSRLFEPGGIAAAIDETVQCVGVRDFYQEAETAAGMAQELLREDPGLKPADLGVLLPDEFGYTLGLEDAFSLAGLALSGQFTERWRRDLGAEAVFHFLFCRQKPAPAMALAACLSSPLMPWTAQDGAVMARRVMDGRYDLSPPPDATPDAVAMIKLIRRGDSHPKALSAALERFASLLAGGEAFAIHRARGRDAARRATETLERDGNVDWVAARRAASPRYIANGDAPRYSLEGVTVLRERHEPWRDVRHLFVLGFHQGCYPRAGRPSAVFPPDDLRAIERELGLPLRSAAEEVRRRRQLFRRQLRAASDSVTLLTSRRRVTGEPQSPSESLVFIEPLFAGPGPSRSLVAELDSADERARIRHLPLAPPALASPPRDFLCDTLRLSTDLIALRSDTNGRPRPESPSSLETLLVSPLAWLLRRVDAEPTTWAPEEAGPAVLGSLAHGMFERLFRPGESLPAREALSSRAGRLLDEVAIEQAPFVRSPQWRVERLHLAEQGAIAAETWRDTLKELRAEVLASEQWLEGEWSQIAVHGQADLILALADNRLVVVDYKWSKADGRHRRMESGFDTQASIYRAMARTGGPKPRRRGGPPSAETQALSAKLRGATEIGIVYYMMKDRICLADKGLSGPVAVRGWQSISEDVARVARGRIEDRLADARAGIVPMNLTTDREFFSDLGVSTYALDASPLIGLFSADGETGKKLE